MTQLNQFAVLKESLAGKTVSHVFSLGTRKEEAEAAVRWFNSNDPASFYELHEACLVDPRNSPPYLYGETTQIVKNLQKALDSLASLTLNILSNGLLKRDAQVILDYLVERLDQDGWEVKIVNSKYKVKRKND